MDLITEAIISAVMPKCPDVAAWVAPLNSAMSRFDITDGRRAAAFLAQVAHESSELTHLLENLNYSAGPARPASLAGLLTCSRSMLQPRPRSSADRAAVF